MDRSIKWAIGIVITIIVLTILNPFVIISAGERGVVLNLGAVSDNILMEGLHFRTPFLQSIKIMDVRIQKEEVETGAASKDLQELKTTIALNYHIDPTLVNQLYQKVGTQYKKIIIDPAVQEAVKAATAKYNAEESITKRSQVKEDIKKLLAERLQKEYITVDEVSITDFDFSDQFNKAIENKVTNEQNALAAKNLLEQKKYEAEQVVVSAQAQAESIKIQAQAITSQGGADYVKLQWIKAWEAGGAKVPSIITSDKGGNFIMDIKQ